MNVMTVTNETKLVRLDKLGALPHDRTAAFG